MRKAAAKHPPGAHSAQVKVGLSPAEQKLQDLIDDTPYPFQCEAILAVSAAIDQAKVVCEAKFGHSGYGLAVFVAGMILEQQGRSHGR